MKTMRRALAILGGPPLAALPLVLVLAAPAPADSDVGAAEPAAEATEVWQRFEEVEERTESLAAALDELALRLVADGVDAWQGILAAEIDGRPLPLETGPAVAEHRWLDRHPWQVTGEPRRLSRRELVASLAAFFALFPDLEGLDFEVLSSRLEAPDRLAAVVRLALQGRNRRGYREWVRGEVALTAVRGEDGGWSIVAFDPQRLESLVARRDLFREVTDAAGVAASDLSLRAAMESGQQWYPNAAAATDVDRDGLVDLFVTGPEDNRLYLNRGDGTFRDAAAAAGLKTILPGKAELNPTFVDHDNDGDADLFLTAVHENVLLENRLIPDGRLLFRNLSLGLPQDPDSQGWSVAAGDADGNGFVDLYVVSYLSPLKGPMPKTTVDDTAGRPNLLYLNQGDGTFREAAQAMGVADSRFGMAAQFADIDGDFDLDLYVANDFGGGNPLYINQGGKRFVDEARQRGAELAAESMGVSFADYDNDGDLDLHVTNMSSVAASRILARFQDGELSNRELLLRQWSGNSLLENQGDGTFRDVSAEAGPFLAEWAWGGGFLDIDNDGWEDLHTPNGFFSGDRPQDGRGTTFFYVIAGMQEEDPEERMAVIGRGMLHWRDSLRNRGASFAGWSRDAVYLNRGDGRFLDVSGVAGADTFPSDARSSVYADLDNDGDLDVFVRATHGKAHFLFRNEVGHEAPFLRIDLEGRESGRDAFGAVVRVEAEKTSLTKVKHGGNGYLAQNDPRLLFGLAGAGAVRSLEVRWPSGRVQRFSPPLPGDSLRIVEGRETLEAVTERRFVLGDPTPSPDHATGE